MNVKISETFMPPKYFQDKPDITHSCYSDLPCKSKVYDLDLVTFVFDAENVFGFQVKMQDVFCMHVVYCVTDLPHKLYTVTFCELKVIIQHPLK